MVFRPAHSLLRVEVPSIHAAVDTSSSEHLFGMWSLFSKASFAIEDGARLENLSWRLFCLSRKHPSSTNTNPVSIARKTKVAPADIPSLSSSLGSISSEELEERDTPFQPATFPRTQGKCAGFGENRGRGHITPNDLEKMVISIQDTKALAPNKPLELPIAVAKPSIDEKERSASAPSATSKDLSTAQLEAQPLATEQLSQTTPQQASVTESQAHMLESSTSTVCTNDDKVSQSCGSDSSSSTEMSTHSVVRGFVPGGAPSSYRSQTNLAAMPTPILKNLPQRPEARPKKKGAMFTIGTSSGEDESSLEKHMFKSALSASLKRSSSNLSGPSSKKQTSFKEEVAIGRAAESSPVFEETDDEEEEFSESAIEEEDDDEDDSSDWEDSEDQSAHSSMHEGELFQRVDSRPNLTSRRSLLTTLMHEPDRAKALANAASRSTPAIRRSRTTSPNGPSVATSPEQGVHLEVPDQDVTRSKPIIMTTSNTHPIQLALSPRTTRRNMLSTELTESLRKNLLWERQHRSTGNLAALRRRHTSNDVKTLKQHPEPGPVLSQRDGTKKFTNDYFDAGLQEYHAKGW